MKLPQRTEGHTLEELSRRFFQNCLPKNWSTMIPQTDYGVDLLVSIFDGTNASPYELNVQLKASKKTSGKKSEKVSLTVATYNHLRNFLHVVMLAKYIAEEKEAYWILLVEVPEPRKDQQTFTISIPKTNKLSNIDWNNIETYIREIVDHKLTSADAIRNRRRNQNR